MIQPLEKIKMAQRLVQFRGRVSCQREAHGPLALTLTGRTADDPDGLASLAFAMPKVEDLPQELQDSSVAEVAPGTYHIRCGSAQWTLSARSSHLHHEVSGRFHAALPPRPAPLSKRLFWRVVLAMAGSTVGRRILLAVRRR